jgi:hypothetical protein
MLYMTIGSEYWQYVDMPYQGPPGYSPRSVGQEAVARQYYEFCGSDGCTASEMYKFMSGYQQWGGKTSFDDKTAYGRAQVMAGTLNNNFYGNGALLASDINQILNHQDDSPAVQQGWIYGAQDNKPWQFFSGPIPANVSFGFGQEDYAILAVNASDYYLFMFTWYQTNNR